MFRSPGEVLIVHLTLSDDDRAYGDALKAQWKAQGPGYRVQQVFGQVDRARWVQDQDNDWREYRKLIFIGEMSEWAKYCLRYWRGLIPQACLAVITNTKTMMLAIRAAGVNLVMLQSECTPEQAVVALRECSGR